LNMRRGVDPEYVVLHTARCYHISRRDLEPGAYTGRGYRKICATTINGLQRAGIRRMRRDGESYSRCKNCNHV
jgi:hypothetical protein